MVAVFVGKLLALILKMLFNVFSKASYFNHFLKAVSSVYLCFLYVLKQVFVQGFIIPLWALHLTYHIPGTPYLDDTLLRVCCPFFPAKEGHTHHHSTGNDLDTCQWHSGKNSDFRKGRLVFESRFCHVPILWVCFLLCKKEMIIATFQGIGVQ